MDAGELAGKKIRAITSQYWNFKEKVPEKSIVKLQAMMDGHAFEMDVLEIRHNSDGLITFDGAIGESKSNLIVPFALFDRMSFVFTAVQPEMDTGKVIIGFQP